MEKTIVGSSNPERRLYNGIKRAFLMLMGDVKSGLQLADC
jgi:hypothetical protein